MDYQPGILARIEDADDLLDRAAEAIAIARRRGCTVGYVRVAFDQADVDAMPAFVVADACADPEPDVHAFLTERIYPRQASVITVADLEAL
jgi:hypothetical protein